MSMLLALVVLSVTPGTGEGVSVIAAVYPPSLLRSYGGQALTSEAAEQRRRLAAQMHRMREPGAHRSARAQQQRAQEEQAGEQNDHRARWQAGMERHQQADERREIG